MKKKILLIDADMTLFDFEKAEKFALEAVCRHMHLIVDGKEALRLYHHINEALWRKLELGEVTQSRLRVKRFEEFFDALHIADDPQRASDIFVHQLGEGCFIFPQALSLLQNLYGRCRVGILTNGITEVQKKRMAYSGLSRYVQALIISQEQGFSKPDPRIVHRALEIMQVDDASQVAIVGDSLTSDMMAAKNARVDGIWYNPSGNPRPDDNPYIKAEITQLHELIQFV